LQAYLDYFDKVSDADDRVSDADEKDDKLPKDIQGEYREDDKVEMPCKRGATARVFMEGMTGDQEKLPFRDQVRVVVGFAEQETSEEPEKPVALLDDRKSGSTTLVQRKACRPNRWALTSKELRAELSKPVTKSLLFIRTCTSTNI
jgi:hypothetical protein